METNQVTLPYTDTHTHIHAYNGTYGLIPGQMYSHSLSCAHDAFQCGISTQWRNNFCPEVGSSLYFEKKILPFFSTHTEFHKQ